VIGTDAAEARLGGYAGPGNGKISILDGIRQKAGNDTRILFAPGPGRYSDNYKPVPETYLRYKSEKGLRGEYFDNISLEGEPVLHRIDKEINFRWTLFAPDTALRADYYSIRWTGKLISPKTGRFKIGLEGDDGYRLYINGKMLVDSWRKQTYRTTVMDYNFEKNKSYDIRVDYYEPDGNATVKLIWNIEGDDGWQKKIDSAVSKVRQAAVAVVVVGITEGEFQDRAILSLPGHQEELIEQIAATGKPVVVLLTGGSAITMSRWLDKVQGLVDIWYPGEEGGHAIADVLFGDYNPAGRLPISFPVHEAQLPWVYYHKSTGRGDDYNNLSGKPLYPFGYGLSYTTFKYSDMVFTKSKIETSDSSTVSCVITNTGAKEGDEVVQLYIRDELASVARPLMELKGFQRIHLKAGESRKVDFVIKPVLLSMLNLKMERVVEPGDFRIMIGASSSDIRLKGDLTVVNN